MPSAIGRASHRVTVLTEVFVALGAKMNVPPLVLDRPLFPSPPAGHKLSCPQSSCSCFHFISQYHYVANKSEMRIESDSIPSENQSHPTRNSTVDPV